MALFRFSKINWPSLVSLSNSRAISTSPLLKIKEIKVEQVNDTLEITGVHKESPRANTLVKEVKNSKARFCPKCTLGLDIKHTDVLILSQFLSSDGCILPRKVTGLCAIQQKNIGTMILMAQQAGLMPNIAPANSNRDPKKRSGWKKFNQYYDETTITFAKRPINNC